VKTANDNEPDNAMLVTLTRGELKALMREALQEVGGYAAAPSREFLTPEQLGQRLGVNPATLRTLVSRYGLPSHIIGPRLVRYLWSEVEQWLMKRGRNLEHVERQSHLRRVRS